MDVHTKAQKSYNMSRIRSENTLPERIVFEELKRRRIRFSKHAKLPGKPDVILRGPKIAVFINGEFWHGKRFALWKDELSDFWKKKISDNIKRDRKNYSILKKSGYTVIKLWGRDIRKNRVKEIRKILNAMEQR